MELHIKERLLIPGLLPEQNNFKDFNIKKSIIQKISITAQDRKDYKIRENDKEQCIEWDMRKDQQVPLNVEFTSDESEYLKKVFEGMSEEKLTDEIWSTVSHIYDEFQ